MFTAVCSAGVKVDSDGNHLFSHLFTQQTFIELLLCAGHVVGAGGLWWSLSPWSSEPLGVERRGSGERAQGVSEGLCGQEEHQRETPRFTVRQASPS